MTALASRRLQHTGISGMLSCMLQQVQIIAVNVGRAGEQPSASAISTAVVDVLGPRTAEGLASNADDASAFWWSCPRDAAQLPNGPTGTNVKSCLVGAPPPRVQSSSSTFKLEITVRATTGGRQHSGDPRFWQPRRGDGSGHGDCQLNRQDISDITASTCVNEGPRQVQRCGQIV